MVSIRNKIVLTIFCPLLSLALLTTILTIYPISNYFEQTAAEDLIDKSIHEAYVLEQTIEDIERSITLLSYSLAYQFNFDLYEKNKDVYLKKYRNTIAPLILKTAESFDDCQGVYFIFAPEIGERPSEVWYNYDQITKYFLRILEYPKTQTFNRNIPAMDYYYDTIDYGKPLWTSPFTDVTLKKPIISYNVPVIINNITIGVAGFDLSMESIRTKMKEVSFLQNGYAFLINSEAEILYHPQFTFGDNLGDIIDKDLEFVIEDYKSGKLHNSYVYDYKGVKKRLGYTRLSNDWILTITVIEKEIFHMVIQIRKILIIINTLVLILTLVLTWVFSKQITEPIDFFTKEINLSTENYNHFICDTKLLSRDDEIGKMAHSFLDLQITNKEVLDRMITHNVTLERMAGIGKKVGSFTHELKTPLGVVFTALTLSDDRIKELKYNLDNNLLRKSELRGAIEEIQNRTVISIRSISKSDKVINNFKNVVVSGSNIEWESFNLKILIKEIIETFSIGNRTSSIEFIIKIEDDLEFYSCPGYLGQIFTNLFQNSKKHGFLDQDSGKIIIESYIIEQTLILNYYDNGSGINKNAIKKIFRPYFTSAKESGGTGLGLHIIKTIITNYLNGTIELVDDNNPGVFFQIKLPCSTEAL